MSLGRFKYRFIKLYMLIGSDWKGWGKAGRRQRGGSWVAHLEALDSLASEDAIYFSKYYFLDLIVDTG